MKIISASFLCDKDEKEMIKLYNNSNTDYIHYDIMDGSFVKEKFISKALLPKLLKESHKKNDLHLMVNKPVDYIKKIALYDISFITVQYEIKSLREVIDYIKNLGFKAGIALKPETNVEKVFPYLKDISLVLILGVTPGSSGQSFILDTKEKVIALKKEILKEKVNTLIEVDGGINEETIKLVEDADIFVSGSFIQKDIANIDILKNI